MYNFVDSFIAPQLAVLKIDKRYRKADDLQFLFFSLSKIMTKCKYCQTKARYRTNTSPYKVNVLLSNTVFGYTIFIFILHRIYSLRTINSVCMYFPNGVNKPNAEKILIL